ncbi:MAG: ABC transporter permease [Clostridia bacterium]|nr:ABC transporter permease [Clostridia bacterium]
MGIYLKLLLKNIKEKKTRSCLIIFSITMAAALFFASMSISDTMVKTFTDKIKKSFGDSEIKIAVNDKSPARYFDSNIADSLRSEFEYTVGILESSAVYKPSKEETVVLNLNGMNWEDVQLLSPVKLLKEQDLAPFEGRKIVISRLKAEKYGLKVGDTIELQIEGSYFKFTIAGIADSRGIFTGSANLAVVPKDLLSSIVAQKGSVSTLFIKLQEPQKEKQVIHELSEFIKRYDVKETISEKELEERTVMFTSVLSLMLVIIIALSIFIIYVSFKVIAAERLPLLGTLRSIGASKRAADLILVTESAIYGVIGGVLACAAGVGILYLLAVAGSEGAEVTITITYHLIQFPITFFMAILLSVMSSILPILNISRLSIKDIVLNKVELKEKHRKKWKLIAGVIFLSVPLIAPGCFSGDSALLVVMLCILLSIAGTMMLIPYLTAGFIYLFEKVYVLIFGNIGVLAAKNLKDNKNILNNISLLTIGIATVLMVNVTGKSAVSGIMNFTQNTLRYDVTFAASKMDRSTEARVKSVEGVKDVCGFYIVENVEVKGFEEKIRSLEGVGKGNFADFKKLEIYGVEQGDAFDALNSGRNIILGQLLSARYKAGIGDKITLILNKQAREYKVIGLMDTMNEEGNYAIISDRYFKLDTGSGYYTYMGVKTNTDAAEVFENLKNTFSRSAPSGETMEEMTKQILGESSSVTTMMDGISILTMLIGVFGVLNNLTISFIQRKRSIAVLNSVGMSKFQTIKMIFVEALSGGLVGGVIGSLTGWIMILMMPYLTRVLMATIPMEYSVMTFLSATAAGIVVTIVASVGTAIRSSRLSIVQSIKYD